LGASLNPLPSFSVTLFGCSQKPLRGLCDILADSLARAIGKSEIVLGFSITLLRCLSIPADGFVRIFPYPYAMKQTKAKIPLPVNVPLGRALGQPLRCSSLTLANTFPFAVPERQIVMSFGMATFSCLPKETHRLSKVLGYARAPIKRDANVELSSSVALRSSSTPPPNRFLALLVTLTP
jgi:hypothetical protein